MNVKYLPNELNVVELLKQTEPVLADVLGPQSAHIVEAQWETVLDHKMRVVYRLTLRDHTGKVVTDFARDEIENPLHLRFRLHRLWGDLLQVHNDKQHRYVQELMNEQVTAG